MVNPYNSKASGESNMDSLMGRVMPQAVDLEEAVLGAALLDKDAFPIVVEFLDYNSFYLPAHQEIYAHMKDLFSKQIPIDLLTIQDALKKSNKLNMVGGLPYLMDLSNKVASAANIEYHGRIVLQKHIQRALISISNKTIKDAFEDSKDVLSLLDEVEQGLYEISDQNLNTGFKPVSAIAAEVRKELEEISKKGDAIVGVPSGFDDLDKVTNGWQSSDLIIIAARPGMGKTAFVLSLAKNAAERDYPIAIFSLEMEDKQLVQRLISMDSEISTSRIRAAKLDQSEWNRLNQSVEKLSEMPIYIDDTPGINIFELRAKCRRLKQNHNIQMIVIDYLQLMSADKGNGKGQNREQQISTISRSLKGLAKELKVPVIALSQLSRAVETRGGDKRPMLSDLRESGAIEQDADIVTFVYRPGYYNMEDESDLPDDVAQIIIAKHRNGSLEDVNLRFIADYVKFAPIGSAGFSTLRPLGQQGNDDPFGKIDDSVTISSRMNTDDFEVFDD